MKPCDSGRHGIFVLVFLRPRVPVLAPSSAGHVQVSGRAAVDLQSFSLNQRTVMGRAAWWLCKMGSPNLGICSLFLLPVSLFGPLMLLLQPVGILGELPR